VNFVAHTAVAARVKGDDCAAVLMGAALPDFAAMMRVRLEGAHGPLAAGIALHHTTDGVFHTAEWFLDLERSLRARFAGDGLPEGAARACAHVGPELLLDGALLERSSVAHAIGIVYDELGDPTMPVIELVDDTERERWRAHLVSLSTRLDPFGYQDPAIVAQRLYNVLRRRPRLQFDDALIERVAGSLADVQPAVTAAAFDVLNQVVRRIAAHRRLPWT
jgi:hypothetical protein